MTTVDAILSDSVLNVINQLKISQRHHASNMLCLLRTRRFRRRGSDGALLSSTAPREGVWAICELAINGGHCSPLRFFVRGGPGSGGEHQDSGGHKQHAALAGGSIQQKSPAH